MAGSVCSDVDVFIPGSGSSDLMSASTSTVPQQMTSSVDVRRLATAMFH